MFNFIVFVALIVIGTILNKYIKLTDKLLTRISKLSIRIAQLEDQLSGIEKTKTSKAKVIRKTPSRATTTSFQSPTSKPAIVAPKDEKRGGTHDENVKAALPEKEPSNDIPPQARSDFWLNLEKQFVENWTGILGAVIMVMGVSFFGVYAALKLSPFYRFLLIVIFSGILAGGFYYLKSKPKWLKLALWLRSSAGAIFLFACLGAGSISGLQWIENPLWALSLLICGILVNLYWAFIGGAEIFASLHVLLSLVALSVAPQSNITFIIAAIVTVTGVALTYREKWDYHLLLTISSFFAYHLFWYAGNDVLTGKENIIGILTVVIVCISAAFTHYREDYRTKVLAFLPFAVHLLNWFYLGVGLLLHTTALKWKTILIILGSIAAFFLARRAKKIGIRWLYHTDTLIAQLMALIAIITLTNWNVNRLTIMGLAFLQTLVFLGIMLKEKDEYLYRIGTYIMHLQGIGFIAGAFELIDHGNVTLLYGHSLILFVCVAIGTTFHIYTLKQQGGQFDALDSYVTFDRRLNYSGLAILIGFMVVAIYANLYKIPWSEYGIVLLAVPLVYLRQKYQSNGLGVGVIIILIGLYAIFWSQMSLQNNVNALTKFGHSTPFFILSLSCLNWSYLQHVNKHVKWIGIYLFSLHLFIVVYFVFNPVSSLIPGIIWLTLSLVALEASNFYHKKFNKELEHKGEPDRYLLHVGYFFVLAFLLRHIGVHLQAENYIGIFKVRVLIELFALGVFSYWAACKSPDQGRILKSWVFLHPLFIELILLFSVFTISLEVDEFWHPIIWTGCAFGCLYVGNRFSENLSRLRLYSLLYSWATAFQVAFLTSSYVTPSTSWQDQAWLSAVVAIVFQFSFIYYFYNQCKLENIHFPESIKFLLSWVALINEKRNQLVFYPMIICVAIFLYWSFDKSILTLLWVGECFLVFVLSILLKENHFRYTALGGLGGSIIRLVCYDLSQTNTITRAFVFFGVGIIMLLINSAYNKYKGRFAHG